MTPLGPDDVLAPIGHNWTREPEGHRQVRDGHGNPNPNNWGTEAGNNDESDGLVNRMDAKNGWKGPKGQ